MSSALLSASNAKAVRDSRSGALAMMLVLLACSAFINYIDRGNLSIAAPMLKNELGISISRLGILLSSFFWTYTVMLFLFGWMADRFDVNRVLAAGFLAWSLATAATGLVRGFAMLLVMRLILGVGESVAFPCYSKILARHLPEHDRGLANGAIIAGMKFGPAAGALGAGWLMAQYGWRAVFLAIGGLSLVWLPAWLKWMPRGEIPTHPRSAAPRVIDIMRQPPFWATAAGGFCNAYVLYFTITWIPYFLVHERRLSIENMVITSALYYAVDATSALATGYLTDLWIRRGSSASVVRKTAMALGWIIAAVGFVGCSRAGPESFLSWLLLAGVGCGMGNSGLWAFSQTFAGSQAAGKWTGLQNGFCNFAGVIGPALTGFTVEWTGHFQIALAINASVCVMGALIWIFVVPPLKAVTWRTPNADGLVRTQA
jgi:ACS family D-galactonate transporter-like MFS transporter